MARAKKSSALSQSYFEHYAEYNRILRSWFVAFGVGGLALFLLQSPVREALRASGQAQAVGVLLLIGVTVQVLVAFLNKYANWYCYYGEDNAAFQRTRRYAFWSWVTQQFWIDIILDLVATGCFLTTIVMLFDIFAR